MLTQDILKELLHYDPETGVWTNLVRRGNCSAGSRAGTVKDNGYRQIRILGKIYLEQRLAFLYMLGRWPEPEAEHKDRQRTNNRWLNLREATHSQNQCNKIGSSKTGFKGVYFEPRTGKYYVQIRIDGRKT